MDEEKNINNNAPVGQQNIGDHNTNIQVSIAVSHPIDSTTPSTSPKQPWNIPYLRNDYFTGREEILAQLHTRFKAGNATALSQRHAMSGLGGIGKTQTAVEYAYRYHEEYQAVLWTRAESKEALTSSFVEIARLLDLPQKDEKDQTITVQAVKRWLQDNHGWLLILDNADEPKVVREFLPTKCDGHILLTTRAQALGGLAQRIEVDTFTPELGALFLLRRATIIAADAVLDDAMQSDCEVAMQISEELGGLPLALDQAGAYIEEVQCNLADYLSLYRTRRAEVLKERGGLMDDHPDSVATTWSLSFQRVEENNAAAADLLRLCAFLAPDAIPEEIITKGAKHLGPVLQAIAHDPMALNKAIAALGVYSLIRRDPAEKTLSVHRLVQAVLREAMSDEETKLWAERMVLAVSETCPAVEFKTWLQWERYLPQALVCAELVEQYGLILKEVAQLLQQAGWYLAERARYAEAEPLVKQAFDKNQGKYEQAEPLYQRALAIREQQLGADHPDTAQSLNNLAGLYYAQGKYEEAEPLFLRALSIYEQLLGADHPDTATSLNNLALLYENQGKYEEAEPLFLRALSIYEQLLGADHPHTALILNNLALLYKNQGKYEQAEPLYQRALKILEHSLGLQHPNTQTGRQNYADLLRAMGRDAEAEQIKQEEYNAVLILPLQQLVHNLGDSEHDDENEALLWLLQEMLGHDGLLALVQELQEHIDDDKYNALLLLAQQTLGLNTDEAAPTMPDDEHNEEAKQIEEQQ